ncbi:hypothetical protein KIN20_021166 [Parelaphostrongylus tenuis]|uniref:Uncharacterized protein n=1 Tax=Parelaphostrongylus tenuis TaxID=148309 RepID=A0AAD5N6T4_PARTN|nr:hypothetical protein KIN20_021166 [Parelaphostrongylus tenuis]
MHSSSIIRLGWRWLNAYLALTRARGGLPLHRVCGANPPRQRNSSNRDLFHTICHHKYFANPSSSCILLHFSLSWILHKDLRTISVLLRQVISSNIEHSIMGKNKKKNSSGDDDVYVVESILDKRKNKEGKIEYR